MLPRPEKPSFRGNPAELTVLIGEKIAFARRDLDDFELRGWNAARLARLEADTVTFRKLPTDEELAQGVRKAEKKRADARTSYTGAIQTVLSKVRQVYHPESAEYRGYGAARLHQVPDPGFALLLEQVAAVGLHELASAPAEIKAAYQQAGLSAAELAALDGGATAFRKLLLAEAAADTRRAVGAQTRIRTSNAVYATGAALCDLGKSLFIATDAARYNDYLLAEPGARNEPPAAKPKQHGAAGT